MTDTLTERTGAFDPYVPRVASEWDAHAPGQLWQAVEGSLVFVDISGFTNLSEKLARRGRVGAEELTSVLNRVFGRMLTVAYQRGGSLLKFGGDALLILFDSPDHHMQAVGAAVDMRAELREAAKIPTSVGKIPLKMSVGVHTGAVDFFLVGDSHRELIITGPTASMTTEMEGTAEAGEIVVSKAMRDALPSDYTGDAKGEGWILRKRSIPASPHGPIVRYPLGDDEMRRFVPVALREKLGLGLRESEHRIATVGFLKYKGIDALMASGGPEEVGPALDELVCIVQHEADAEGVTFLATDIDADGGKIILVTGVPGAQEDDEGRMLRVARKVLDARPRLAIRFGVNRGHVFAGDVGSEFRSTYTIMGDTVNLAARLMAAADPGSLYASPAAIDRSLTLFRTEALEPFYVKGKEQPVQAFELFEETGTRSVESRNELPFLGREPKLEAVLGAIALVENDVGRSITITGDTGMGKTRLIQEVEAQTPHARWFTVRGEPHGKDNAYWALRDPLRDLLGIERQSQKEMIESFSAAIRSLAPHLEPMAPLIADVAQIDLPDTPETESIEPRFRPARTADAVIELFQAIFDDVSVLVFDDAHWLDEASTALIDKLGSVAVSHPWLVLVAGRTSDSGFEPIGTELPLEPLEDEASSAIVVEATRSAPLRPPEVEAIVRRAGGNPLFLTEILRVVRETGQASNLPDSLDAVVSSQIDQLPPLTKQVMRYSAVLGRSFRRAVLDDFLAPEGMELDSATRRVLSRYLEEDGPDRLRFRHAVVHDVAYEGLPYRRRRELHARAGKVIENLAGDDLEGVAEFLAFHYAHAGNHTKTWRFARIAADRATRAYANSEAAAQIERALEASQHMPKVKPRALLDLWTRLGEVRGLTGQFDGARDAYAKALKLTEDPVMRADLHMKRALVWMQSGNLSNAKRNVTLGRKDVGDDGSKKCRAALARLDAFEARLRGAKGDFQAAFEVASRAEERARAVGEDEARARALNVMDLANFMMTRADDHHYAEEAVELYEKLGRIEETVRILGNLGGFAYMAGKWDEAIEWYTRSMDAARKTGNLVEAANTQASIGEVLVGQRKYTEAAEILDEAERTLRASNALLGLPFVRTQAARATCGLGKPGEAAEELEGLFERQLEGGDRSQNPDTALHAAEALVFDDRPEEALDQLDRFEAETPQDAGRVAPGVARVRGRALTALGRTDEALTEFERALEMATMRGDRYEEALVLEARAETRDRAGIDPDPVDASRLEELFGLLGVVSE